MRRFRLPKAPLSPGRTRIAEETQRLLREAEETALRRAGVARVVIALLLIAAVEWAGQDIPIRDPIILRQIAGARVILWLFFALAVVVYVLARQGLATRQLPFVTASVDAALILGNLAYNHIASGISGDFIFTLPAVWVIPIALAANAVYYRPGLQLYAASLYVVGILGIILAAGTLPLLERPGGLSRLFLQFGPPPNGVRLLMLVSASLVLIMVALQGRRVLDRAVREATLRGNLARYLPRELTPVLTEEAFESLRAGRRITVALLFVDMRDSTAIARALDPARLAEVITAFRSRVVRAASRHGGMVDKFIGDGALVLFGVPAPGPDDAARALACARDLLVVTEEWNREEGLDPPVKVGVGVHCGEVFCGVVGEQDRLEFTVLGEPVAVAARLEQATKSLDSSLLASETVVASAGERGSWVEVSREPLRGVERELAILKPA